jgi:hypothetical protein
MASHRCRELSRGDAATGNGADRAQLGVTEQAELSQSSKRTEMKESGAITSARKADADSSAPLLREIRLRRGKLGVLELTWMGRNAPRSLPASRVEKQPSRQGELVPHTGFFDAERTALEQAARVSPGGGGSAERTRPARSAHYRSHSRRPESRSPSDSSA